ncbi:hypothetical protein [Streptomyces sp. NPDC050856]|uniref:hypothetical protein n=1 Tax=Streptomyces sp. NPDC050856 TaxID=3154939 RepID=UPI0033EED5CF
MRQTTEYVRRTIAERGLEKVTLATSDEAGSWADARNTGYGRRGHVWLGMRWLHPRHTTHLPAVLEHELAHLQRRDTGKRIAAESIAVTTAGLLSLPACLLTAAAAWLLNALFFWCTDQRWEETTARTAWKAGDLAVCGTCHADDVAREEAAAEAAAEAARLEAAAPPEPQDGPEPGRGRGWFRRRT